MNDILGRFQDAKRDGAGWAARCPAHDDHRASLSIGRGEGGRWLLHCHAGCELDAILAAVQLEKRHLFPEQATTAKKTIVATYDYRNEAGELVHQVCRFEPKDFRQRRADGAWKMKGVRRVLYHLDKLQHQTNAYIAEGEQDVDRLWALGLPATCNAGGAGKWREEYTQQLIAAGIQHVVILPDNDGVGRDHAQTIAASCYHAGLQCKVVELPDLPLKGDVSDWLQAGHTRDELEALVKATSLYTPAPPTADGPATSGTQKKGKPEARKQGREVQLEDPEPWADPVNGAALVTAIAEMFTKYLVLPAHASTALALWMLHCFAFDAWFTSPFLAITSPVKRCGKTLLLMVLAALVPRRLAASNVTPAVLFRTIEKYAPTLLIDEADTFLRENDELRGVLNSGHTRTTAVAIRAVGDDHEPRAFSTWCPKAIFLIGKLPDTLADRSIEVEMRRRTADERVARLRQDRIESECSDLRRQAARWAADHLRELQDADPDVPAALHDRAADCWRPLIAIADLAGGSWPDDARKAAVALMGSTPDPDINIELLHDIHTVFGVTPFLKSGDLVKKLTELEDRPWADWKKGKPITTRAVADRLLAFGIMPTKNEKDERGYFRDRFEDAWTRYPALKPSNRRNPNNDGPDPAISNRRNEKAVDALKMQETSIEPDLFDGSTVQHPYHEDTGENSHPDSPHGGPTNQEDDGWLDL